MSMAGLVARSRADGRTTRGAAPGPSAESGDDRRSAGFWARVSSLVRAIEENDEAKVEEAVLRLSRSRRVFAPRAFMIGAFVMLYDGLRLLVSNWRLTLVQILPAMWIWLAMFDLKAHTLHGNSFNVLRGPGADPDRPAQCDSHGGELLPQCCIRVRDFAAGRVEIRPAMAKARGHWVPILISGAVTGALLAVSAVVTRWGGRGSRFRWASSFA